MVKCNDLAISVQIVSAFLTMARKVANLGKGDIKIIVIRMDRMGKEQSIRWL